MFSFLEQNLELEITCLCLSLMLHASCGLGIVGVSVDKFHGVSKAKRTSLVAEHHLVIPADTTLQWGLQAQKTPRELETLHRAIPPAPAWASANVAGGSTGGKGLSLLSGDGVGKSLCGEGESLG